MGLSMYFWMTKRSDFIFLFSSWFEGSCDSESLINRLRSSNLLKTSTPLPLLQSFGLSTQIFWSASMDSFSYKFFLDGFVDNWANYELTAAKPCVLNFSIRLKQFENCSIWDSNLYFEVRSTTKVTGIYSCTSLCWFSHAFAKFTYNKSFWVND